jgi:hypothetical protein
MTPNKILRIFTLVTMLALISGCTADKLQARLQADPQCKSTTNPKTGALMPCPGSDKEFYQSVSLANVQSVKPSGEPIVAAPRVNSVDRPNVSAAPSECKPQLHQKSGALMPCPAP